DKHKKCSGGRVCAYCCENNLQCVYNENRKKRGPKTQRTNNNRELR
ncbi:35989_t:CDS:1, partial [Racocetra persica]